LNLVVNLIFVSCRNYEIYIYTDFSEILGECTSTA